MNCFSVKVMVTMIAKTIFMVHLHFERLELKRLLPPFAPLICIWVIDRLNPHHIKIQGLSCGSIDRHWYRGIGIGLPTDCEGGEVTLQS